MSLSIGIVGLPNVGKSTLFNALTKKSVPAENYPFCTIDPSVGIVPVPDDRLDKLAEMSKSKKVIPAVVEFVDIAGLVKGASEVKKCSGKWWDAKPTLHGTMMPILVPCAELAQDGDAFCCWHRERIANGKSHPNGEPRLFSQELPEPPSAL